MLRCHRDLKVYQLAYKLAMEIFHDSKAFPKEERYSLTDQIRRSSRVALLQILQRLFENANIPTCLSVNYLTRMPRQLKHKSGWISPRIVVTYQKNGTRN